MIKRKYGWRRDTAAAKLKLGRLYRPTFKAVQPFPSVFHLGAGSAAFGSLDQGQLGSCTGFGCKRVSWYGLLAAGQAVEPSALFQYYNERVLDGDPSDDSGSTITEGINALKQFGICPESDWPYNPAQFAVQPPVSAYTDAIRFKALQAENIPNDGTLTQNLQDALFNQKLPVVFGADLFAQFESEQCAANGVVQMPAAGEQPIGGHCQVIRGWKTNPDGSLWFQVQNSWGQWGDNGCDWMIADYLLAHASDFWAVVTME